MTVYTRTAAQNKCKTLKYRITVNLESTKNLAGLILDCRENIPKKSTQIKTRKKMKTTHRDSSLAGQLKLSLWFKVDGQPENDLATTNPYSSV